MLGHIFKLFWRGRRLNFWLILELTIVFIITWYIVDMGFQMLYRKHLPMGFETEQVYTIDFPVWEGEEAKAKCESFFARVKHFEGVKSVYMGRDRSALPFSTSFSGGRISADTTKKELFHAGFRQIGDNAYFEILGIRSLSTGKIARLNEADPTGVIVSESAAKKLFPEGEAIGREVYGSGEVYRIIDIVADQKESEYQLSYPTVFVYGLEPLDPSSTILFSVGEAFDRAKFEREVGACRSLEESSEWLNEASGIGKQTLLAWTLIIFFGLSVALGIVGSFWFRMRRRHSEIGLRMSLGSTRREIQWLFVGEALVILLASLLPALGLCYLISDAELMMPIGILGDRGVSDPGYLINQPWTRLGITAGFSLLVMALLVGLSAWIPARQGANLNPVDALRDE